jgi:hypothetical protein
MMRQQEMSKLKSWRVNERVYVVDEKSHEEPLWATLVDIEPDLEGFSLMWDHNGSVGRQALEDIDCFEAERFISPRRAA